MRDFDIGILNQMAKRFNPLPTNNAFLDGRYDWQKNENGEEWPYYRFFYHLAKWLQPEIVLELGSYQGTAAAHFAGGYAGAKVITVDHHTDPGDEFNKRRMLHCCAEFLNIEYLQGWSTHELAESNEGKHALGDAPTAYPDIIELTLKQDKKIDILFIDSWHKYEYAIVDYHIYSQFLSKGALVICDDITDGEGDDLPISGMIRFWDEMPEPKFLNDNLHGNSNTMMGFIKYEKG